MAKHGSHAVQWNNPMHYLLRKLRILFYGRAYVEQRERIKRYLTKGY